MSKKQETQGQAKKPEQKKAEKKQKGQAAETVKSTLVPRFKVKYREEVIPALRERFGYDNPMRIPKVVKVVVSMGVGQAIADAKLLDGAVKDMQTIAGQKPIVTVARKSISNFKLREGNKIGCCVTLRRDAMYFFLEKLFRVALPRVRDFGGVSPDAFDGRGNFSMGLKEQLVFPEIDFDSIDKVRGMNIAVVTTARTDEEGRALLAALGCPFREA